jgi:hypothetical protein
VDSGAFWALVERAREGADGDVATMADTLAALLDELDRGAVAGFQQQLVAQSRRTYTWNHGDAADLVCGRLGDDGFTDFRSWMLAQGRQVYEAFVADPDALADVDDVERACEGDGELFAAASDDVYEEKGGGVGEDEDFPLLEPTVAPAGERLPEDRITATFPRTAKRFAR